ncbi:MULTISPECIES: hypothetical protein [Pseudomonas]|uniref:Chromosome segregation protein SMC n=1 Tax=Pseudomonas fulva TaxID=47880 RepID=A0A0D0KZE6_9PSED|nr:MULTISPECIES: hypothetical protein [Pseudomonas]KIQ03914.1 hypothetical protein RU08_06035 [Pseudomonas fulva]
MQELNELKQELATLTTDKESLELRYAELQKVESEAPQNWSHLGNAVGSSEFYAAQEQRMTAGMQLDEVKSRIERLNRRIQYLEQLAGANKAILAANEAELLARQSVERLEASAKRIAGKLTEMRKANRTAFEQASHAEQEAAQSIATAASSGEPTAEKAAQTKMAKAAEGMAKVKAERQANQPLLRAFEAEATTISGQLEVAQEQLRSAIAASSRAMALKLGADWDQAAGALVAIGAELIKHGAGHQLTSLKVPTFAPGNRTYTQYELRDLANGKAA